MQQLSYSCFNFIIYSFFGWVIEEIYCYYIKRNFSKPNFLNVPLKPMYGISMTLLIIIKEYLNINVILYFFLCFIIPTGVEYISGYILKNVFKEVYWSYSAVKYNINSYICLKFSFYWQVLSFIGVYYVNPIVKKIYTNILSFSSVVIIMSIMTIVIFNCLIKVSKIINPH